MTNFDIITIFPRAFDSYLKESIIARAINSKKIKVNFINLRDFAHDKHRIVDDRPYGGGPGMVFKVDILARALKSTLKNSKSEARNSKQIQKSQSQKSKTLIILFSPAGKPFNSKMAVNFAQKYNHIIMIAGHYEGVDERIKKVVSDFACPPKLRRRRGFRISDLSIGPYVLTGGELPAMVVVDAVSRYIPGVLGKDESLEEKRFGIGVPVYTRPEVFKWPLPRRGEKEKKYTVPKVLLSGNHKKIEEWRKKHQKMI